MYENHERLQNIFYNKEKKANKIERKCLILCKKYNK